MLTGTQQNNVLNGKSWENKSHITTFFILFGNPRTHTHKTRFTDISKFLFITFCPVKVRFNYNLKQSAS